MVALASVGLLGGCVFAYDATRPSLTYDNHLEEDVIVSLEGADFPYERSVRAQSMVFFEVDDECLGTAIVVETSLGDPVGRVDEAACRDMKLTINEDGTLEYEERSQEDGGE